MLALRTNLPLRVAAQDEVALVVDADGVALSLPTFKRLLRPAEPHAAETKRRARSSLLARACGPANKGRIIDATAGLGRDAAVLVALGYAVTLIERNRWLSLLLEYSFRSAGASVDMGDAVDLLADRVAEPDVIYLDPMYERSRRHPPLPSADLQMLAHVTGSRDQSADDADRLLAAAWATSARRIVVKRALAARPLRVAGHQVTPHHQLVGKLVRFDVYRQ